MGAEEGEDNAERTNDERLIYHIYIYTHIGHGSCFAMPRNAEARFKLSVQAMLRQAIHTMLSLRPYGSNGQISAPSFSNLHGSGACTREMWQTSSPSGRDNPHLPGETCFSFWKSTKCCRSRLHMSAALAKEWVFPSTMPPACWHAISWS